ncbi:MAG: DUF1501 domain-containing protein [Isosphaerales bacterium]
MNRGCPDFRATRRFSRRALLRAGSAGFAGLNLPAVLGASRPSTRPPRAKSIIFLHQFGGPSHIDTFDMKPGAPDGIRGTFSPIASSVPGTTITEHLPRLAKVMHRVAQVRSVSHRNVTHNSATYYSLTGHAPPVDDINLRDTQELYPAYGSVVARLNPVRDPAIPSFVSYPYVVHDATVTPGQTASFLGKPFDPFFVERDPNSPNFRLPELSLPGSMTLDRLDDRRELMRLFDRQSAMLEWSGVALGMDSLYDRALTMLSSPKVKRAFDLAREDPKLRDVYGRNTYGQGCLLARRLVEAGVRFVTVYFAPDIGNGMGSGGWDTHNNNFNDLKDRLLPITDQAVPALIDDLHCRGLLDETLIVWLGEFGRTPKIGGQRGFDKNGRDHWPRCYTTLLAGGGVRGGAVHGASDRIGAYPTSDPVRPDDIAATMFWAIGIDPATEVYDTLGRPLPIAAGDPITSIFG